jgi:type IV pilus assembly protein PilX
MTTSRKKNQEGFVLVVALVLLAIVSLLAVNGMGVTTMNERMAGNHMDRGRAYAAAEQALTQAQDFLRKHAEKCLAEGCVAEKTGPSNTTLEGTGAEEPGTALPSKWSDTNSATVTLAKDQDTRAKYLINWLSNAAFSKTDCQAYSIMGHGQGIAEKTVVILQTVAYVCPAT